MTALTEEQLADVRELLIVGHRLKADVVVIGATAYRLMMDDADRHTVDIDLAVALDIEEFSLLERALGEQGWTRSERLEHRWTTPRGTRFDLLPAGPQLRRDKRVTWPRSGFVM